MKKQVNWIGNQRLDLPQLRLIEANVSNQFDIVGRFFHDRPIVVSAFNVLDGGIVGTLAETIRVATREGCIFHPLAGASGTWFEVDPDDTVQTLGPSNARVEGVWQAGLTQYLSVALNREADADSTSDVVFLSTLTLTEEVRRVPIVRKLDYTFVISTASPDTAADLCPIAKVVLDGDGRVTSCEDIRPMLGRLGTQYVPQASFLWSQGRTPTTTFTGGERAIGSIYDLMQAMMTAVWEVKGGERWFSPTNEREVKLVYGQPVLANGDNFDWDLGTETIEWASLSLVFANSTAIYNDIEDDTAVLADGQCLYVDIDRTANRTGGTALVMAVADLATLGAPTVPGSRYVIAWRKGDEVFFKDKQYEAGRTYAPTASESALGIVRLHVAAPNPSVPLVPPIGTNGILANTATGGNTAGMFGTGFGAGVGVQGQGGATDGSGVLGTGGGNGVGVRGVGGTNGHGVRGDGDGDGHGVFGVGGATGVGVRGTGGSSDGDGVYGVGGGTNGSGVRGEGNGTGVGVVGVGGGTNAVGVSGFGGTTNGIGVRGEGAGTGTGVAGVGGVSGGVGVLGTGTVASAGVSGVGGPSGGAGVTGTGGATSGTGVLGTGGATNGIGVQGQGTGSGSGVVGIGGASGSGVEGVGIGVGYGGVFVGDDEKALLVVAGSTGAVQVEVTGTSASLNQPTNALQLINTQNANGTKISANFLHSDGSTFDGWALVSTRVADDDVDFEIIPVQDSTVGSPAVGGLYFDQSTQAIRPRSGGTPLGALSTAQRFTSGYFRRLLVDFGANVSLSGTNVVLTDAETYSAFFIDPTTTSRTILSLTGGERGQIVSISNVGAFSFTINSSVGADCFNIGSNISLAVGEAAAFIYDGAEWRRFT